MEASSAVWTSSVRIFLLTFFRLGRLSNLAASETVSPVDTTGNQMRVARAAWHATRLNGAKGVICRYTHGPGRMRVMALSLLVLIAARRPSAMQVLL